MLVELEEAAKGLGQVVGLEDVRSLDDWLLVEHLPDQVPVDLTQAAVQHLSTFEHVKDPVSENLLAMAVAIDVEEVLVGGDGRVHFEVERLDVESQSERVLLHLLVELKIRNYRVLRLRFVSDRERDQLPFKLATLIRLRHIFSWMDPHGGNFLI